ncbi:hypothetical protein Plhal304r1_c001g0003401 [Plasmopara halstedii]
MQLTTLNHLLSSIFFPSMMNISWRKSHFSLYILYQHAEYHRRHAPLTQEHDFFFISSQKTLLSYVQAWSA